MRPGNTKLTAVMIIFSYAMLTLLLMVFVAPQTKMAQNAGAAPVTFVGGGVSAVLSLYWSIVKLAPRNPLPEPRKFQVEMLYALAFAELVSLLGIFIGAPSVGPWPFAIVSWVLILGLVLPRTLQYFRFYGSGGGGRGSTWSSS